MLSNISSTLPQTQFHSLHQSLQKSGEMLFDSAVDDQRILEIFSEHGIDFDTRNVECGVDAIYTPFLLHDINSRTFFLLFHRPVTNSCHSYLYIHTVVRSLAK